MEMKEFILLSLKQQLQLIFGLDNSRFASHESDLYVMVEGLHVGTIFRFIERRGWKSPVWFISDVDGQPWYGKRCIDIPFASRRN